jgi:hypothetical protein
MPFAILIQKAIHAMDVPPSHAAAASTAVAAGPYTVG